MYTKLDLEQNKIMNEIIKQNQIRMRKINKKIEKKNKFLDFIIEGLALVAFLGFIYLLTLIYVYVGF